MKPTIAFLGVVMAAAVPLAGDPAFAHDDDYYTDGRLVLSFGSAPLVWVPDVGLYVALGARSPTFYVDGFFFLFDDHHWYRARRHNGPWVRVEMARLPNHLRRFRRGDWPHYQSRAERYHRYNRYRQGPPQRGPRHDWRERTDDRRDTHRRRGPDHDRSRPPMSPPQQHEPRYQPGSRFDGNPERTGARRQEQRGDRARYQQRSTQPRSGRSGADERGRDGARDDRRDR